MTPTPVVIVRPELSIGDSVNLIGIGKLFYIPWIVMLFLPTAFDLHWGYWRVFAACFIIRSLVEPEPLYKIWTRAAKR